MKSADIVLLARLHSYVGTPQMRKCPPIYKVPAFKKIPVGELGPTKSLLILEQAKKDVAAVKQLLPAPKARIRKRGGLL